MPLPVFHEVTMYIDDDYPFAETSVQEHTHDCPRCCNHWGCADELCDDSRPQSPSRRLCPICEDD